MGRAVLYLGIVVVLPLAQDLSAQEIPPVRRGELVRVTYGCSESVHDEGGISTTCQEAEGWIADWAVDTFWVVVRDEGAQLPVPRTSVSRLRVYKGRQVDPSRALALPVLGGAL